MAPITQALLSALLLVATIQPVFSAPVKGLAVRQLAGEGQALDSIFTDTDNAVGYGTETIEENAAGKISSVTGKSGGSTSGGSSSPPPPPPPPPPHHRRQLAGEGQALDSVFTDTDNAVGYGVETIEENTASTISGVTGKSGGSTSGGSSSSPTPPPPLPHRRQLDKIANGAGVLLGSAGLDSVGSAVVPQLDSADGELTSGAANAGATIGSTEESTVYGIANAIPKRQADKICNGAGVLTGSLGIDSSAAVGACDSADGETTSGAADAGATIGSTEESTVYGIANAIPRV